MKDAGRLDSTMVGKPVITGLDLKAAEMVGGEADVRRLGNSSEPKFVGCMEEGCVATYWEKLSEQV